MRLESIILALGVGEGLRSVAGNPKCLLEISEVMLLERYLKTPEKNDSRNLPKAWTFVQNPDSMKA